MRQKKDPISQALIISIKTYIARRGGREMDAWCKDGRHNWYFLGEKMPRYGEEAYKVSKEFEALQFVEFTHGAVRLKIKDHTPALLKVVKKLERIKAC